MQTEPSTVRPLRAPSASDPRIPSRFGGYRLSADCLSVVDVGGDFYHVTARDGLVTIAVGDVSGHGAAAARLMRVTAASCRAVMDRHEEPREILRALDEACCATFPDHMFVTSACVALDRARRCVTVANAGHVVPVLRKASGETVRLGSASGPPLGIGHHRGYVEEVFPLDDGDILVLMTDGVVDAVDPDPVGMGGILELIARSDHSAVAIMSALSRKASSGNPACGVDDRAVVAVEWAGRDELSERRDMRAIVASARLESDAA